jgi:hypothetical protein
MRNSRNTADSKFMIFASWSNNGWLFSRRFSGSWIPSFRTKNLDINRVLELFIDSILLETCALCALTLINIVSSIFASHWLLWRSTEGVEWSRLLSWQRSTLTVFRHASLTLSVCCCFWRRFTAFSSWRSDTLSDRGTGVLHTSLAFTLIPRTQPTTFEGHLSVCLHSSVVRYFNVD